MVETGELGERPTADSNSVLREQEAEFYQAVVLLIRRMPPGTTVEDGRRVRQKWVLKYGRQAPL